MSRVTQNMMSMQMLRNLNQNMARMDHMQNQMNTERKINKPSDEPVGISFAMRYRSEMAANDQYMENVDSALSWLDSTDSLLDQVGSVLLRARDLTVKAANGPNPQEALDAIEKEVNQLYEQLITIGNSKFNGKQTFSGQMTDVIPYTLENAMNEGTDSYGILIEIGVGVKMAVNVTGNQTFGLPGDADNAFQVIHDLKDALRTGNFGAIAQTIEKLDTRITKVLEIRADVGAKVNRIELAENRLKDININMETLRSKVEGADMAELIMGLKAAENVFQTSLSVGARIIRPSLIDFLR